MAVKSATFMLLRMINPNLTLLEFVQLESPQSNLLPEVDSLPDGFVDGAAEPPEANDLIQVSSNLSLEQKEAPLVSQTLSERLSQIPTLSKETASTQNMDSLKPKKQEVVETKRKGSKNMFKSEKEFLEFMIKYQQVLSERDSAITVRDKLESLCRELQRQNKMLMEECKRVSTEGQTLRSDLSTKFQEAIKDVSIKLDEQKNESHRRATPSL